MYSRSVEEKAFLKGLDYKSNFYNKKLYYKKNIFKLAIIDLFNSIK